ncbi:MAG: glycosyltransferase [Chitinophagaceae bacterium]|nr:glycosyltransferase [Chitinophagaceae bacterium]
MAGKNILLLSYRDHRGDGVAAFNIGKYLHDSKYNVKMVVSEKTKTDTFIVTPSPSNKSKSLTNTLYKKLIKKISKKFLRTYQYQYKDFDDKYDFFLDQEVNEHFSAESILNAITFTPDLILVASIHDLINTTELAKIRLQTLAPVYFLMMDMFPLTGGCHHAWDCEGYKSGCKNCPAILNDQIKDRAGKNFEIKSKNIRQTGMNVIALSGRTLEQAKQSLIFKDQKIFYNINGFVDQGIFNDYSRDYAKHLFKLSKNDKVIFTGAEHVSNERKGFKYFIEAIKILHGLLSDEERSGVVVMIAAKPEQNEELLRQIPFRTKLLEFIQDDRLLSVAYQAADVFVCSSIEDPGPITVSQALACGTPVAGFYMGSISNLVKNNVNGYKAPLRNSEELAFGIAKLLKLNEEEFKLYSNNAIEEVSKFSSKNNFLKTVEEILNN